MFSGIRLIIRSIKGGDRRIVVALFWTTIFVVVGKFAGGAKEVAIAWRYGVSDTVDSYVLVFNMVVWPVTVWLSVLTIVLVPFSPGFSMNPLVNSGVFNLNYSDSLWWSA